MPKSITKQYIQEIKQLFPVYGKQEKEFMNSFLQNMSDYIECKDYPVSLEDLHTDIGTPTEIISDYLSHADTEYLAKKIRFAKHIKMTLFILITVITASSLIWLSVLLNEYHTFEKNTLIHSEKTYIE